MTRWVLVVEDQAPLGEMLCDNLRSDGYGCELVRDGGTALERLANARFDLVILDVMLPVLDGFSVLQRKRERRDATPVLVLSARASDEDRIRGLELLADDYLTKPFHLRELLLRVSALLRRGPLPQDDGAAAFAGNTVDFRAQRARTWRGDDVALTGAETRLLRLLTSRPNQVVSRREALDAVFGPHTPAAARTIDNLVAGLRRKFERTRGAPACLQTVRGQGWRLMTLA